MKSIRNSLAGALLAAGALLTAATSISIANAADAPSSTTPPPARPYGWHHGPGRLYAQLNLTADQQAQLKTIMTNARPQMKSIHQQMKANSLKLRQTQPNNANYSNVVAEVSQANAALHSQMITLRADVRSQVFNILTPAQQTQLAALEAQTQNRPHGAWGRGAAAPPAAQ
ncbi:MAG: Spy/CpxP family protein refolding chaperone [Steroidobacteraceae bacterium]